MQTHLDRAAMSILQAKLAGNYETPRRSDPVLAVQCSCSQQEKGLHGVERQKA